MVPETAGPETWTETHFRSWVSRIRGRDPAAEMQFLNWFQDLSYRIAFNRLGDRGLAEDVCQMTLTQIHGQLLTDDFSNFTCVRQHVCQVACRRAIDEVRRRAARQSLLTRTAERVRERQSGVGSASTAPQWLESEQVRAALDKLKPADKELLIMAFWDDLPSGDIAKCLGVEPGNLKVLKSRAMARLREILLGPRSKKSTENTTESPGAETRCEGNVESVAPDTP